MRLTRTSAAARIVALNAKLALADGGVVKIFSGDQPARCEDPETGIHLATGQLDLPAFDDAYEDGSYVVAKSRPIQGDATILADGVAGWFRVYEPDGKTAVYQGTCGRADANMLLNSPALVGGVRINFRSLTFVEYMDCYA